MGLIWNRTLSHYYSSSALYCSCWINLAIWLTSDRQIIDFVAVGCWTLRFCHVYYSSQVGDDESTPISDQFPVLIHSGLPVSSIYVWMVNGTIFVAFCCGVFAKNILPPDRDSYYCKGYNCCSQYNWTILSNWYISNNSSIKIKLTIRNLWLPDIWTNPIPLHTKDYLQSRNYSANLLYMNPELYGMNSRYL